MEQNLSHKRSLDLSSAALHILAMCFMLCDHLWATVIPGNQWLTCIGRLTYPIYAFMIVEGYVHTSNFRRYAKRLLLFALISEIPFNLMYSGSIISPFHQNGLWTLLMGLLAVHFNEKARQSGKLWRRILIGALTLLFGYVLGFVLMTDYYGAGVLMVMAFYFFRGRKWWALAGQFLSLWYLNTEVLGGLVFEFTLLGHSFSLHQQSLALLALIPIWLYRGRQGHHSKAFQYFCYAFYPVHMLLLHLLRSLL